MKDIGERNFLFSSKSKHTDHLWLNFINGDNECFEIIYKEYADILFRYGIQFTDDEDIVKDAIHDVFVKIYHNRSQLKKDVHLKFYLFTALKNNLYNVFKRDLFFEKVNENELLNKLDHTAEESVIAPLEQEYIREEVCRLLELLTDRQREAIYYRYIEEMSMGEICTLMNMNYQSVQNLIQRSLKKMRMSSFFFCYFLFYIPNSYLEGAV